jgi:FKBP12-rapamycin complex-associated protein
VFFIPQVIGRLGDPKKIAVAVLRSIAARQPQEVLYALLAPCTSARDVQRSCARDLFSAIRHRDPILTSETERFASELTVVAVTRPERAIKISGRLSFVARQLNSFASRMSTLTTQLREIAAMLKNHPQEQKGCGSSFSKALDNLVGAEPESLQVLADQLHSLALGLNRLPSTAEVGQAHSVLGEVRALDIALHDLCSCRKELQDLASRPLDGLYDLSFAAGWQRRVVRAEGFLRAYLRSRDTIHLNLAAGLLTENSTALPTSINLTHASPFLAGLHNASLLIPGGSQKIAYVSRHLAVMPSVMRPRKIIFVGSDGRDYAFLLKAGEDTRLDERVVQFFTFVSRAAREVPSGQAMQLVTYPIVSLNAECGLMGWLSRCHGVSSLVRELWRRLERFPKGTETDLEVEAYRDIYRSPTAPQTESEWAVVGRAFEAAAAKARNDELEMILLMSAADSNDWLARKKNYIASLAATTIAGYVIGLGDRHPSNIMVSLPTGKLVHIDFTDIMEKLQDRSRWPERVPCRLTPAFLRPLDVLRSEGEFRTLCVVLLEALRDRADQVVELLSVFIEDPLSSTETLSEGIDQWKERVRIIKGKLAGIDGRLNSSGQNADQSTGMEVGTHVDELIRAATNREALKMMWIGWRPWW